MITAEFLRSLRGKSIVVMGLGLHGGGRATTQWLLRHGANVLVTDLRSAAVLAPSLRLLPKSSKLRLILGKHRKADFLKADLVVANPGVPATSPFLRLAKSRGIPIVNEATIFFLLCPCPIIGVTGTKGKSTVSTLTAAFLRSTRRDVVLTGNIRTNPMLEVLDRLKPSSMAVAELSSWQLEGLPAIRRSPDTAVLTNLLDDHLNQYASRAAYFAAKDANWKYQAKDQVAIFNRDNPPSRSRGRKAGSRARWFSLRPFARLRGAFLRQGSFVLRDERGEHVLFPLSVSRLVGDHNITNILAAVLVAAEYDVPAVKMQKVLRRFTGVPGRLERVRTLRGVTFINDTTATSPVGAMAGLAAIPKPVILIAGGVDKKLSYRGFAAAIRKQARAVVLLPGTATDKLKPLLRGVSYSTATSMKDAVDQAAAMARSGDSVLLSPGAASFGLFLHEFDRGDQFTSAVRRLR